ncbi:hypothetical protein T265_13726, partial [Opisthorchis viverrini]
TVDCNYTLEGSRGTLNSPNYPRNYPKNVSCTWTILKPEIQSILRFHDFHVEGHEDCAKDFVDVYIGTGSNATIYRSFCNSYKPPLISFADDVIITFRSDADVEDRGFNASYEP